MPFDFVSDYFERNCWKLFGETLDACTPFIPNETFEGTMNRITVRIIVRVLPRNSTKK